MALARALDDYRGGHPDITHQDALGALEQLYNIVVRE
jgi:hypothetical protein